MRNERRGESEEWGFLRLGEKMTEEKGFQAYKDEF